MNPSIRDLFEAESLIARRDDPKLSRTLSRLAAVGEVEAVLPGIYAPAGHRECFEIKVMALRRYDPDTILMGRAAARLSYWPELDVGDVQAITRHRRASQQGFTFVRRRLPDELVGEIAGLQLTAPALTALDLCLDVDGAGIDEVLRRGKAMQP